MDSGVGLNFDQVLGTADNHGETAGSESACGAQKTSARGGLGHIAYLIESGRAWRTIYRAAAAGLQPAVCEGPNGELKFTAALKRTPPRIPIFIAIGGPKAHGDSFQSRLDIAIPQSGLLL